MARSRPLVVLAMVLATSCRDRDDRTNITAANDPQKTPKPAPPPESPMVMSVPVGEMTIPPPRSVDAPPPDAVVSPSGLASKLLVRGSGIPRPGPTDKVKVHYTGWSTDGKMFDSSVVRGEPAVFPVNALIKGFSEALQLMAVGETRRVWIPSKLAYGDTPRAGAPAGTLVFDIALLEIVTR